MSIKSDVVVSRRAAFERLIGQNEAVMLRVSRRLCRSDWDRAQDLVQDALINAYRAFVDGRFQEATNSRAWLLKILTNVFLNDYKRKQREATTVDPETLAALGEDGAAGASTDGPGVALMESTLDERLEGALGELSDEFRSCVILVDVEGLEYAEAASILEIPIGTVRSRLARARLQLHALLYDYAKDLRRV